MSYLFGRLARLTIGQSGGEGKLIESFSRDKDTGQLTQGLHFIFNIEQTSDSTPNKMSIQIYNLSATSRALTERRGATVILEAGYGNILTDPIIPTDTKTQIQPTIALIFKGDIGKSKTLKQGPDWVTTIETGDGLDAYQNAKFSGSFGPGTDAGGIMGSVIGATGLGQGDIQTGSGQYVNGFSFSGMARDAMDMLTGKTNTEWSIQDGKVQVVPINSATREVGILIDTNSGLVGSPHMTSFNNPNQPKSSGCEFVSLLQPGLKPGRRVQIKSLKVNGNFIVRKVKHNGDTRTGPWYSEVEAIAYG